MLLGVFERVTQYDGRLFRTLRALALRPGQLARDHYDGKRARNVAPFELFVIFNIAGWLVAGHLHIGGFSMAMALKYALLKDHWPAVFAWREAASGLPHDVFARRIESATDAVDKMGILFMVPLFALATSAVVANRRYRLVQHLIFSVHFYCIHLTTIVVGWGLFFIPWIRYFDAHPEATWGQWFGAFWSTNWIQHLSVAPFLLPYLFFALRRAYELDRPGAAWRAVLLTGIACALLRSFFDVSCALMLLLL